MSQKTKKQTKAVSNRLLTAVKIGLWACLFMPLVTNGKYIFPFIFPKQIFFQIAVNIVFFLYILLAFRQPEFRPKFSKMVWAVVLYFAFMFLSMIFGVNAYHSFWSNYERMAGFVNLVHYLGFFIVAANVFKTKKDWFLLFDVSVLVSFLAALHGMGQLAGIFAAAEKTGSRISGTIGNASFLAGFMLVNAFFALWLSSQKDSRVWKMFYWAVIFSNLFVMYQTQTRGALLAFFVGVFLLLAFVAFASKKGIAQIPWQLGGRTRKVALAGIALIAVFVISVFAFKDSALVKKSPSLRRFSQISLNDNTAQTRLLAWKLSIKGFAERPLFGWGLENYNVVFNKYYDPMLYPTESWFDRAHNAFIDVLIHNGLVGLLSYLSIFVFSLWFLWRSWRLDKIDYPTAAIFTAILAAYGIQNIFLFDTQVTLLMIFLIWSFIAYLSFEQSGLPDQALARPIRLSFFSKAAITGVFLVLFYWINIPAASTSMQGIEFLISFQRNDLADSVEKAKATYASGTFGVAEVAARAYDLAAQTLASANAPEEYKRSMVQTAIDGLKIALQKEPQNARFMMMLGNLYLMSANLDPSYLSEADLYLKKSWELSPSRQELLFALGQLKIYQGRNEEALDSFKKAVDLNEKVALSHWNYGIIAISVGQKDLGKKEIVRAAELGYPISGKELKLLANAFVQANDWPEVERVYQEWISLEPGSAEPWAGLAAVYAQIGKKSEAKQAAQKAIELNPLFKTEGETFIKNLGL